MKSQDVHLLFLLINTDKGIQIVYVLPSQSFRHHSHEEDVRTLEKRVKSLKGARERVQKSVDAAQRNGEEIYCDVDSWLSSVDEKILEGVERVIQDEEKAMKKCFIGLCPNPWTRYKHGHKVKEQTKVVAELLEKYKFESISYRPPPRGSKLLKGFEEFESRTLVSNGIMEALKDDGITAAYSAIEWSYNYLESEEVKLTFLLCSLIGHDGLVEELVRYTVGLELFGGVNTMEEARDKVLTIVANLKESCLLLESYNDERFDVHDIVSDVALKIASRDNRFLVFRDHMQKEWSDEEKMNNLSWISLRSQIIADQLPKEMECSSLSLFHMAHYGSVEIPPDFFKRIQSLKVLDLFGLQLPSLPVSINHLTDLHTLCLKGCGLADITIIGKLQNLEILDLAESDIKALLQEITQLTQLKLLDLSRCTNLEIIPPNVLSKLSNLEELYMERSFAEWEDEVAGKESSDASLDELKNLPHLAALYVHIPDVQMIPKHRFLETLNRYKIFIGDHYRDWEWSRKHECSRTLKLKLYTSMHLENGVKMLLKNAEDLDLEGLEGIKNVLANLNDGEFSTFGETSCKKWSAGAIYHKEEN